LVGVVRRSDIGFVEWVVELEHIELVVVGLVVHKRIEPEVVGLVVEHIQRLWFVVEVGHIRHTELEVVGLVVHRHR
jgi:hypothetical protein